MSPDVLALLKKLDQREGGARLGSPIDAGPARNKALKLGLITKRGRMKVGHSWLYTLTEAGRGLVP